MNLSALNISVSGVGPLLILCVTALVVLAVDCFWSVQRRSHLAYITVAGCLVALVAAWRLWGIQEVIFGRMMVVDNYSTLFTIIFIVGTLLTALLSVGYTARMGIDRGEYYALLLFTTVGMIMMAQGLNLVTIFLGLEILSISLFILAGMQRHRLASIEASLKYFLLGAFSSAFFLYGVALTYGATSTLDLQHITRAINGATLTSKPLLLIGVGLMLIGFGFKVAMVPFHVWTPDVYEGAPTTVTAFMSVGSKAAGFGAFVRVFSLSLQPLAPDWTQMLWVIAVATMVVGNVVAIAQSNIKRMLAYSSIAHAGYIVVAMVAANALGTSSILFYLLVYTFMNLGAFGVVLALGRHEEEVLTIDDYAGLGRRAPALAAAMALFMFALAGIPPTAGFVGKFYIFSAAVQSGFIGLAVIGVMASLVSVYYYLRVVVVMYMREPAGEIPLAPWSAHTHVAVVVAAAATLALGLFPNAFMTAATQSLVALL
ncbi:MAG: NADH-quinone oxidoreductase subunit N [Nitrospinota bacterium]